MPDDALLALSTSDDELLGMVPGIDFPADARVSADGKGGGKIYATARQWAEASETGTLVSEHRA